MIEQDNVDNYLIHNFQSVLKTYPNKNAVVLKEDNGAETILSVKEVECISDAVSECIRLNGVKKYSCVGLFMDHNIYIPSIILRWVEYN